MTILLLINVLTDTEKKSRIKRQTWIIKTKILQKIFWVEIISGILFMMLQNCQVLNDDIELKKVWKNDSGTPPFNIFQYLKPELSKLVLKCELCDLKKKNVAKCDNLQFMTKRNEWHMLLDRSMFKDISCRIWFQFQIPLATWVGC